MGRTLGKTMYLALALMLGIGVFAWADGSEVPPTGGIPLDVLQGEDEVGAEQKKPIPPEFGEGLSFDDQAPPPGSTVVGEEVEVGEVINPPRDQFAKPFTDPKSIKTYVSSDTGTGAELRRANAGTGGGNFIIRFYQCEQCHTPPSNVKNVWKETVEYYNPPPPEGDGEKVVVPIRDGTW